MRVHRSSFDDDEPPSLAVCRALGSVADPPVATPEQLDDYVSSAGLDSLFDSGFDPGEQELLVSFLVEGYQVLLFGDRRVTVRDRRPFTESD